MKQKNIKERLKQYFFINPTKKIRVRQLERDTNSPLPSVIRYCNELEKEGLLKSEKIANVNLYSADRTSKVFLLEKKLFNLRSLSKLTEHIILSYDNPTIILFGSYSKGEDIEDSDIDFYIETQIKTINIPIKFEEELERRIQIFHHQNINKIENKNLANNIINGIILNGFVEVL